MNSFSVTHALSHLVNGMRMHMNYSDYIPINPGPSKEGTTLPWFLGEGKNPLQVSRDVDYPSTFTKQNDESRVYVVHDTHDGNNGKRPDAWNHQFRI